MIKNPKHVILLGKGEGWQNCPDKDTNAEVWGLNTLIFTDKKMDRLFIMDGIDTMPSVIAGDVSVESFIHKINELKVPVVAPYKYEEIPTSEAFPMEEVIREFGVPYFNNTIAFMIAYALLKGVTHIETWGINQASSTEYFYEKGCVEYWLGIAAGMGVNITINGNHSELLRNKDRYGGNKMYGYNVSYEKYKRNKAQFGEFTIKKLLQPVPQKNPFRIPTIKENVVTLNTLEIKNIWQQFANHPEGKWIMPFNDCLNLGRLIKEERPKRILDLGGGIGCSAEIMDFAAEGSAEIHSVEQFDKCIKIAERLSKGVKFYLSKPVKFEIPQIPDKKFAKYEKLPEGKWDLVVVDGPGPWEEYGKFIELTSGDIFTILDKVPAGGMIYVQMRKETTKTLLRYYSEFVKVKEQGQGFTLFQRTNKPFKEELIVDKLQEAYKKANYIK